jgi:hypothetical protein
MDSESLSITCFDPGMPLQGDRRRWDDGNWRWAAFAARSLMGSPKDARSKSTTPVTRGSQAAVTRRVSVDEVVVTQHSLLAALQRILSASHESLSCAQKLNGSTVLAALPPQRPPYTWIAVHADSG